MKEQRNGLLLVVSGPAGVGKGTLDKALMERNNRIKMSVSATTRAPRPGEVEGVHYFFKTEEEFKAMVDRGEFLEYMHVFGSNYYGTPRSFVEQHLANGYDVILEIDVQGAMKVKQAFPDAVLIFITAPSMSEIKSRLIGRGTESMEQVEKRFATAFEEVKMIPRYDYVIVNDVVDKAVHHMEAILEAERCRVSRSSDLIESFMEIGR
ncbi:MAG: guanylate kinase [Clostridia bacterium]|nr:guanylate kinase [Clostridia bacterium]MBQ6358392.1 guanylate kinase [Clostridia bacterium]MBQ6866422.1 guanylate kinase [Clostridia bacterium]MBQ6892367.1 guanylate kinase [Clostridia bacterium]MBQ7755400.1 guanylate kinase [Clostridia bacterium]